MRENDQKKLMDKGFKLYSLSVSACVIRRLQPDLTWKVLNPRRRSISKVKKDFEYILNDPMSIGI